MVLECLLNSSFLLLIFQVAEMYRSQETVKNNTNAPAATDASDDFYWGGKIVEMAEKIGAWQVIFPRAPKMLLTSWRDVSCAVVFLSVFQMATKTYILDLS